MVGFMIAKPRAGPLSAAAVIKRRPLHRKHRKQRRCRRKDPEPRLRRRGEPVGKPGETNLYQGRAGVSGRQDREGQSYYGCWQRIEERRAERGFREDRGVRLSAFEQSACGDEGVLEVSGATARIIGEQPDEREQEERDSDQASHDQSLALAGDTHANR